MKNKIIIGSITIILATVVTFAAILNYSLQTCDRGAIATADIQTNAEAMIAAGCTNLLFDRVKDGTYYAHGTKVLVQSNLTISNAGASVINGTYLYRGIYNGKPFYTVSATVPDSGILTVVWENDRWSFYNAGGDVSYYGLDDVAFPWQVTTWQLLDGDEPFPTVTEQAP